MPASAEVVGQSLLRIPKDLDDGDAVAIGKLRVLFRSFGAAEDLPQSPVDRLTRPSGQFVEDRRVNHVAARIAHQSALEVELPQRASPAVERPPLRELLRKAG